MSNGETITTVVGNLPADPELRYTQNGLAVANFTIASTPRTFDRQANDWKDGETYVNVSLNSPKVEKHDKAGALNVNDQTPF